jgi:transcriptional regulator with XRE-family HTH domain
MAVGSKIKQYIEDKGIKQKYLAEQTGLTERCISHILNDKQKPDLIKIKNICDVLNVDINIFLQD